MTPPSAFQSAASLPSFAARPRAEPAALPSTSSGGSAGGHVEVLRTASVPALPVIARAASDLVIFEERISLGARPRFWGCAPPACLLFRHHTRNSDLVVIKAATACVCAHPARSCSCACAAARSSYYICKHLCSSAAQKTSTGLTHTHLTRHLTHACICALLSCMWSCASGVEFFAVNQAVISLVGKDWQEALSLHA